MIEFDARQINNVVILKIIGKTKLGDSRLIKEKLEEVRETTPNLIIDFSEVDYIGSSVLGVMATEIKIFRELGGDIKLISLSPSIRRLFRMTCLEDIFAIFPDVERAYAGFSS